MLFEIYLTHNSQSNTINKKRKCVAFILTGGAETTAMSSNYNRMFKIFRFYRILICNIETYFCTKIQL